MSRVAHYPCLGSLITHVSGRSLLKLSSKQSNGTAPPLDIDPKFLLLFWRFGPRLTWHGFDESREDDAKSMLDRFVGEFCCLSGG